VKSPRRNKEKERRKADRNREQRLDTLDMICRARPHEGKEETENRNRSPKAHFVGLTLTLEEEKESEPPGKGGIHWAVRKEGKRKKKA